MVDPREPQIPGLTPLRPVSGRRRRRALWVATLAAVVVILLVPPWYFGLLPFASGPPVAQVTEFCGGNLNVLRFVYTGTIQGYLFLANNITPQYCTSVQVPLRSSYDTSVELHNADTRSAHTIQSVTIDAPYGLERSSPPCPALIPPESNLTLVLTIQVPGWPGTYGLPSATVSSR
jgi:hypothetical protein